jgi:hypothetical protein
MDWMLQTAVQALVPLRVGAETDGSAVDDDLEDAAQRVAGRARRPNEAPRLVGEALVAGANVRRFDGFPPGMIPGVLVYLQLGRRLGAGRADAHRVAAHLDAEVAEEEPGQGAGGNARRGLAGAGALQHVPQVVVAVLHHAGEVGVTGAQTRDRRRRVRDRLDVHAALPVGPVQVVDGHRDGTTHGEPVPHAGDDVYLVVLDLLPSAAAVALLAAAQVVVDHRQVDRQPCRKVLHEDGELRPVRFAGGHDPQVAEAHDGAPSVTWSRWSCRACSALRAASS